MGDERIENDNPVTRGEEHFTSLLKAQERAFEELAGTEREKRTFLKRFESAQDPKDLFKYVFLVNTASIHEFVAQSKVQSDKSFRPCLGGGVAGFALLALGVVVGFYLQARGRSLAPAVLTASGGALTEFLAGTFFWMYSRTLSQINLFYSGMSTQEAEALRVFGRDIDPGAGQRD